MAASSRTFVREVDRPGHAPERPQGGADALRAIDEFVSVTPPVAQEITVDLMVIAVSDPPQRAVALPGNDVAPQAAVHADGGGGLQVPFAREVGLEGLVGKHPRGADLHQVAAEFALQGAVLKPAEIDLVMAGEDVQILAPGIVMIKPHASVALDAAVHLVVEEGAQILIAMGPLGKTVLRRNCGRS